MVETNVDRSSSTLTAVYCRTAKNPAARPRLDQLAAPDARTAGGRLSSPGGTSALEAPDSSMAGADSDSSLCGGGGGDLTPVRHRSRFDVHDDCPPAAAAASRRLDDGRRARQARSTQLYSPAPAERLHSRSVVYINMLAVGGGTGSGMSTVVT